MSRRRARSKAILAGVGISAFALAVDGKTHCLRLPSVALWSLGAFCVVGAILHTKLYCCATCGARVLSLKAEGCAGCGRAFVDRPEVEVHDDVDQEIWARTLSKQMAPLTSLARYESALKRVVLPAAGAFGVGLAAWLWARNRELSPGQLLLMVIVPPLFVWFFLGQFVVGTLRPILWLRFARCPKCRAYFGTKRNILVRDGIYEIPKFCEYCGLKLV